MTTLTGTPPRTAATIVLHGTHPLRGCPVTWHITPMTPAGAPGAFLMERADGHLDNDAWPHAEKISDIVDIEIVRSLVRRVDAEHHRR